MQKVGNQQEGGHIHSRLLLLLLNFPAYYLLYYRHRLYYRFCLDRVSASMGCC